MDAPRYKPTLLDRQGPEGVLHMRALMLAIIVFGFSLLMFGTLASEKLHLHGWRLAVVTVGGAATLAALSGWVGLQLGHAAGSAAVYFTHGGSSTPYEEQFSQEQALVMQRDYAAALNLFEQRIAASPAEPRVRIAAADLYATHGANPTRAAELYREVQRIAGLMSGHDVYVSNKLADLYLGPLGNPGRALVEFRRLMERYPGTTTADHARAALANVKSGMRSDESSQG